MSQHDPISDLLTRIRNGAGAKKRYIDVPWSRQKETICSILKNHGMIDEYLLRLTGTYGTMRVFLKYTQARKSVIRGLKRVSRPGRKRFIGKSSIPHFYAGLGLPVLSTSKGILSGAQAKEQSVGGELLFVVW